MALSPWAVQVGSGSELVAGKEERGKQWPSTDVNTGATQLWASYARDNQSVTGCHSATATTERRDRIRAH